MKCIYSYIILLSPFSFDCFIPWRLNTWLVHNVCGSRTQHSPTHSSVNNNPAQWKHVATPWLPVSTAWQITGQNIWRKLYLIHSWPFFPASYSSHFLLVKCCSISACSMTVYPPFIDQNWAYPLLRLIFKVEWNI